MLKALSRLCLALVVAAVALPFGTLKSADAQSVAGSAGISFIMDGARYVNPPGEPAPFLNANNRIMVPLRFFTQALASDPPEIEWRQAARQAVIRQGERTLTVVNGQGYFDLNGKAVQMDTPSVLIGSRLFVPLRFVSEGLGARVHWDQWTRTVYIASGNPREISPAEAETLVFERAAAVLEALAERDMQTLADYVHPERGVRFTPYSYVQPGEQVVLAASELADALSGSVTYVWGAYDGTGDPIALTFSDYYDRFVFDQDYRQAGEVSYNKQLFSGNAINNAPLVYPGSIIVEYHFDGIDPQYGGMDWRSLRLVFQPYNGQWMLTGIVHDEWTI